MNYDLDESTPPRSAFAEARARRPPTGEQRNPFEAMVIPNAMPSLRSTTISPPPASPRRSARRGTSAKSPTSATGSNEHLSRPPRPSISGVPLAVGSVSCADLPARPIRSPGFALMRAQSRLGVEAGFDGVMVSERPRRLPGYLPNPLQLAGFLLDAMPSGWAAPCPMLLPLKPYSLIAEDLAWMDTAYPGRVGAGSRPGPSPWTSSWLRFRSRR